ncbi:hypothetical protein [Flavobacterium haoranii]|uniref:Uncharacterized protein n=1 Tax=Flavobacterium haoranii TaxID=683124 RepID=A0A1M6H7I2_9FLAO|nr:hypothetical protein [Flavobacterium haoranii]SHJ18109.1 hypothetical protein SAMN05444337_1454 [Flavobacterium haoranii]
MKISILTILFLSINSVFGQNKSVEYNEIIPEYIISIWENNGTSSDSKFDSTDLNETKAFFSELSKRENAITSNQFLKKPTDNTLVANYLNTKLKWNSFNEPHVGLKKELTKKVVENSLKKLPERNELLAFYYSSIFIDVLNKQKPMNLSDTNIDLENLNLDNDTEKAILFLTAMRHVGNQLTSYATTRFPNNCFRAIEYLENMPKFNGKPFYEFDLPEFEDFEIEVDKRKPKMSFKERYIPEFENAKLGIEKCLAEEKN